MRNLIKPYRAFPEHSPVRLFDEFFKTGLNSFWGNDQYQDTPAINISQTDTGYLLEVSAPGLEKEDFSIELEADQLVLKAERKSEKETTIENVIKKEFDFSSFKRSFHLSEDLDRDSIGASYENGILKIKFVYSGTANDEKKFSLNMVQVSEDEYAREVARLKKTRNMVLSKIKPVDLSKLNLPIAIPSYFNDPNLGDAINPIQLAQELGDMNRDRKPITEITADYTFESADPL